MKATVLLLLSLVATNMSSTLRHSTSLLLRFVECFNQYLALQTFESRIKQNRAHRWRNENSPHGSIQSSRQDQRQICCCHSLTPTKMSSEHRLRRPWKSFWKPAESSTSSPHH